MTENEALLIQAARKILPEGYDVVPSAPKRRTCWAVIAREYDTVGDRKGWAYIYDSKPENPNKVGGIHDRAEACIEIEYTPGQGL